MGEPSSRDPDTQPLPRIGTGERKRAALVLGVLAVAAVLFVGIMVRTLGSSAPSSGQPSVANPAGPAVTVTGGPRSSRTSATRPEPTPTSATASTAGPRGGPVSCPTSAKCALPDDVGNAVQAVNQYRIKHGRAVVTGSVTNGAKSCVLSSGNGNCPSGYFWEPVGRSGTQVVTKIAASGGKGLGWLLNPKMTKIQVGWAYLPSSKSFECVLVSNA